MNAGTLTIEIAANVARIKADMDETKRVVAGAMKEVEKYSGYAKSALIGLVGIGSVDAFKGMILSGIEGKARLYDLSLQTGITVEALGAMGKVAKLSNTSLDDVAGASNKLSKALFTQNKDSEGAAAAIKALGLNFDQFKRLAPDQQLVQVAKAMEGFRDGAGKAGGAMELFGKTGAQLLPFLKELAENTTLAGKQTTASALEAKKFEDNLIKLKTASEEWKRQIVNDLLPGLSTLTTQLVEAKTAGEKFKAIMGNVAENAGFGQLDKQRKDLEHLNQQVGRTSAGLSMLMGVQDMLPESMKSLTQDGIKAQRTELEALTRNAAEASAALKRNADILQYGEGPTDTRHFGPKPELKLPPKPGAGNDAYTSMMKTIREKIALDQAELDSVTKLTDGQKLQAKIFADIDGGYLKLTLGQKLATDAELQTLLVKERANLARKAEIKWLAELHDQQGIALQAAFQSRDQAELESQAMRDRLTEYGMTRDQLALLSVARLRDAAAQLEWRAQFNGSSEFLEAQSAQLRDQAKALRDRADSSERLAALDTLASNDPFTGATRAVKEYLADIKRAGDGTYSAVSTSIKGLEDLAVTALTGGDAKGAAKAWVNGILSEVARLVIVKPLLKSIFGDSSAGADWGGAFKAGLNALLGSGGNTGLNSAGDGYYSNEGRNYGGPRVSGGFVSAGTDYLVGERGPEVLRMNGQSGTVIPNAESGKALQITFAPVTHIDSRTDRAEVATLVAESQRENNRQLIDQLRVHGVL